MTREAREAQVALPGRCGHLGPAGQTRTPRFAELVGLQGNSYCGKRNFKNKKWPKLFLLPRSPPNDRGVSSGGVGAGFVRVRWLVGLFSSSSRPFAPPAGLFQFLSPRFL